MMSALWVSRTGLSAQDTRLTTISNNLANASTVGYKRDDVVFEDLLYQIKRQPGERHRRTRSCPRVCSWVPAFESPERKSSLRKAVFS